jgi:4-amino-4-deoxy-L-arabinose transferase-like glycosyltransferase
MSPRPVPRPLASFGARLALVALAGLALRIIYVLALAPDELEIGDRFFYHHVADLLADGDGYVDPFRLAQHDVVEPTAGHPPLYPLVLAAVSLAGGGYEAHRLIGCVIGAAAIVAIGLLGRRVGGDRAGLAAAAIAAVYPTFVAADGSLMAESLYGLGVALTLLAALAALDEPTPRRAAVLGVAVGLTALARAEGVLLLPLLAIPLVRRPRGWRALGVAAVAAVLVTVPWTVRNWIAFDRPVPLSTNYSTVLAGANCPLTYEGRDLGSWRARCAGPPQPEDNEAEYAADLRHQGYSYAREHMGRLIAVVMPVRLLRTWDLYQPFRQTRFSEGRDEGVQRAGLFAYWLLLLPLAVYGAIRLRPEPDRLLVILVPVVLVTITSVLGFGAPRFRHAAEISLVVLAGVAATAIGTRLRRI